MQLFRTFSALLLLNLLSAEANSQSVFRINGELRAADESPLVSRKLILTPLNRTTYSDQEGKFHFEFTGFFDVKIIVPDSIHGDFTYTVKPQEINSSQLLIIHVPHTQANLLDPNNSKDIPVIVINSGNDDGISDNQEISSILSASRDPFVSTANFNLFTFRFRTRGYDNDYHSVFLNGVPMSDPENGNLVFGEWGGLNDVMRNINLVYGLNAADFTIGKPGSNVMIDTRASQQRKGTRISYALSNRSYVHRIMGTYNSGKLANGWSFSLSGSYRWAEEGYIPGTFYKGISYFAGVEKEINAKHSLGLTILGSSLQRGKGSANTLESFELANDHYYNPYWGWQDGRKRNSRVSDIHKPIAILRHDWKINNKTQLNTSLGYQTGYESNTRLDWFQARDPRPDYYKYLPSYMTDPFVHDFYDSLYRHDPNTMQLNWEKIYQSNYASYDIVQNANGVIGNTIEGRRAQYILEDLRQDSKIFNFNSTLETVINPKWIIQGGLTYQNYTSRNYKKLKDLLGADFYVDIDKFNLDLADNNVAIPNHIIKQGEVYGYDYDYHINDAKVWMQHNFSLHKFDLFIGGSIGNNTLYRDGKYKNAKFPNESLGESSHLNFLVWSAKGGASYKINGRNYLYANAGYFSNAPLVENVFIAPRVRNTTVNHITNEKISSVEGGYILNAPYYKLKFTAYLTDFKDGMLNYSYYNDADRSNDLTGFLNQSISNIDHRHTGIELAGEYQLFTGFRVNAMASIGKYYYTSRFLSSYYLDNTDIPLALDRTIYSKNYFVAGTPQQAGSVGISYNAKNFWFININCNYARRSYISPFWDRRTAESVTDLPIDDPGRIELLREEELPDAFTLDFFGGKSFKIKKYFLNLNIGVNNILNNQNILSNGYEQNRIGVDANNNLLVSKFPNKYYYAYGINYFVSLALRF